jgi:hypothetical protein
MTERTTDDVFEDRLRLIRSEYREMPGLTLTFAQVMRLWRQDEHTTRVLLNALVGEQFLMRTPGGAYRRMNSDPIRHPLARGARRPVARPRAAGRMVASAGALRRSA